MGTIDNKRYLVAVVATMSAGKSTLLNAMMCTDLLPSQNEACTATVFKIEDDDEKGNFFSGRYKDKDRWSEWCYRNVSNSLLKKWNSNTPQEIELSGNLPNIANSSAEVKVCFVDTPGPNNAMCEKHALITKRLIADNKFSTLCFVINCSVAGVKDEWQLLFELKKQLSVTEKYFQIIFVLNKIDLLDIEKGEKIAQTVNMCCRYLEKEIGFENPVVIPVSSVLALGIRTALCSGKRLTKNQYCRLVGQKKLPKNNKSRSKKTHRMSRSYICRFAPRKQMELSYLIENFKRFSQDYRDALKVCEKIAAIMPIYEARKLPMLTRKIYIHDRFYTYKELFTIEALAGVGYLEKIIEKHCFDVVPEIDYKDNKLSKDTKNEIDNNDIKEDNNTEEPGEDYISDEEFNASQATYKNITLSQEELLSLPISKLEINQRSFFNAFQYVADPGKDVMIACSANHWKTIPMIDEKNNGVYKAIMLLPIGVHYYKLHADGMWFYLPSEEYVHDNTGSFVNIVKIEQQNKESSEMLQVAIKYNPYLVTTELCLDNVPVPEHSSLSVLTQDRLQNWIDKFLPALYEEKRQKNIQIHFEGTPLDFNDLVDSVEDFQKNNQGYDISISEKTTEQTDEGRLNKLRTLFEEGKTGPFAEMFNSTEMEMAFNRATDPTFEVNVIATMSSGKSTVVNSLLGKELMPAKNEACTATIAKIQDVEDMSEFIAQRFDSAGNPLSEQVIATNDILTDWNSDPKTHLIDVKGNIPTVTQTHACTYVFVDTPGPNNARSAAHEQTTLEAIKSKPLSMVLYVLNATQLSTKDDDSLLKIVCKEMNKGGRKANDRFVFIANKIDAFDPEKKESVTKALENVRQYLNDHGIANPLVIPASAQLAKLIRLERQGVKLTWTEKGDLYKFVGLFTQEPEMNMLEHAKRRLSKDCARRLDVKLNEAQKAGDANAVAEILSGIPIVEELLNDFLQKHALPAKLKDAVDTFSQVMQASAVAGALNEQLTKSEEELEHTVKAIQKFTNDSHNIKKAESFRKKVNSMNYNVSKEADDTCTALLTISEKVIEDMGSTFSEGKAWPAEAKHMIEDAIHRCQSLEAEVNVALNEALKNEYFAVIENLREEYQKYVADIINENFPENDSLRILQKASMELPTVTEMVMDYTQTEQVKTGTKQVKVGTEQVKTGTREVKVGSERVKVGEEKYVETYRTERYGFLWLKKREVPVYAWRDKFESKVIYDTQDVYETRDVYEERDVMEELKLVNLIPIYKTVAKTIRKFTTENVTQFKYDAQQNVEQAKNTLLRMMGVIDERVRNISKQLECASDSKLEKESIVAENRKKVEWYNAFRKKIEDVLAI